MNYYDRNEIGHRASIAAFSSRVYGWMALGLGFTATIAYFLYATGLYAKLLPMWWLFGIALFGVSLAISFSMPRIGVAGAMGLFLLYSGLEGVLFGTILPVFAANYGGQVIWSAFATGGAIFALAMGYGYFTKSDLTSLGRILMFGLIGLIAVTFIFFILSFFMQMTWANLLISYLGLAIFVGLTAYDAQTIRRMGAQAEGNTVETYKLSIIMALKMYINVIMIFWYLLQIFASSSNKR